MNFSLEWIKFKNYMDIVAQKTNLDLGDAPYDVYMQPDFMDYMVDVTGQIFKNPFRWFIKEPAKDKRPGYYIQPFKTKVWIFILITMIIGGFIAMFVDYFVKNVIEDKEEKFNPKDHFFMPLDCMCNQEGTFPKTTSSSRIVCFFIRFLCLFLFGSYSAIITSFSAVQDLRVPFRNIDEFLENGKYNIGFHALFETVFPDKTPDAALKALRDKAVFTYNMTEFAEKLCTENFAFSSPGNDIQAHNVNCPMYQIETPLYITSALVVLIKNSPYKKIFNQFLINYYSSGLRHRISERFLKNPIIKEGAVDFDRVELEQIVQILAIFAIGTLISAVILIGEILFLKVKIKERKHYVEGKL